MALISAGSIRLIHLQGQCGSGAALEDIAKQQRQEWDRMVNADRPQPMSASQQPQGMGRGGPPAVGSPQAELTTPQMQQRLTMARKTPSLVSNLDSRLKDVRQSSK